MKKYPFYIVAFFCLFLCCLKSLGQQNIHVPQNSFRDTLTVTYDTVHNFSETIQTVPQFFYKNYTWQTYILSHINSHIPAQKGITTGDFLCAFTFFTIMKNGKINNLRISIPNPDYGMAKKIVKLFKNCPAWIPATQNGRTVPYRMKQMFLFKVD